MGLIEVIIIALCLFWAGGVLGFFLAACLSATKDRERH